ncbi:MAG: class I SAM-dependent methyltransferase [Methanomassiliicoccales archaeon]|nr:class I SAM-dependent methyltransferase [Methanomassiliicoccales archaeon]NYT16043.1 class I SAM-dependent methyltransferase [Methanomassiliicoccales archaeon]
MVHEPSRGKILVANFILKTFLRPTYSRFVKDLDLTGNENVMDFGSGPGVMSRMVALRLGKGHLTCVDASRNWIEVAKRNLSGLQNVEFRLGRISDIAFPSPFDVIVVHYVLHEVPRGQRESTVKALVSNLKSDGRLVIREPTREPYHGMPSTEFKELMISAGLVETSGHSRRSHTTGVYRFPRANDRG